MVPLSTKKVFTTSDFPSMTKNRRTCWPRRSFVFSSPTQASVTLMAAVANVNVALTWHLTATPSTLYNSTCCSSPANKPMKAWHLLQVSRIDEPATVVKIPFSKRSSIYDTWWEDDLGRMAQKREWPRYNLSACPTRWQGPESKYIINRCHSYPSETMYCSGNTHFNKDA